MIVEAVIIAAAVAGCSYWIVQALGRFAALVLTPPAVPQAESPPPCPDCTRDDSLMIVEHAGTRRYSCQHCPCVYSANREGRTFKHHARALPFTPQIPEAGAEQNGPQGQRRVPPRPDERPTPRPRPVA